MKSFKAVQNFSACQIFILINLSSTCFLPWFRSHTHTRFCSSHLFRTLDQSLRVLLFLNFCVLLFKDRCLHFPPTTPLSPQPPPPPTSIPLLLGCVHVSFIVVPENPSLLPPAPHYTLPPHLWSLSVCSLFYCLWLYFVCLFVLLISSSYS